MPPYPGLCDPAFLSAAAWAHGYVSNCRRINYCGIYVSCGTV